MRLLLDWCMSPHKNWYCVFLYPVRCYKQVEANVRELVDKMLETEKDVSPFFIGSHTILDTLPPPSLPPSSLPPSSLRTGTQCNLPSQM